MVFRTSFGDIWCGALQTSSLGIARSPTGLESVAGLSAGGESDLLGASDEAVAFESLSLSFFVSFESLDSFVALAAAGASSSLFGSGVPPPQAKTREHATERGK